MIWSMVGKDPARGTIVPLYEPPDNMSPAAMRFLERMGFDEKAFTAGIMGLAAKGYLTIEQDESKTYKLVRRKNATEKDSNLSADEKSLARILFEDGSPLVLKNKNHEVLARARERRGNKPARHHGDKQLSSPTHAISGRESFCHCLRLRPWSC